MLGAGGFAEVFLADRIQDSKKVAVKIIDISEAPHTLCEAEIMRKLEHKNIVQMYDYFEFPTQQLLVMECMDGGELLERIISKSSYDENLARNAALNVLEAIQCCHDHNILHRDLKPENLLLVSLESDTDLKLSDFGLAIELPTEGYLEPGSVGTPGYIAPEVILGQRYGKASDMWSFGIVLFILLCGQFPFESDQQVKCANFTLPEGDLSKISVEAAELIRSLLRFNPAERLTVQEALNHSWLQQTQTALLSHDLTNTIPALRNFLAKRKLKGGVHAVRAMNKFNGFVRANYRSTSLEATHEPVAPLVETSFEGGDLVPPPPPPAEQAVRPIPISDCGREDGAPGEHVRVAKQEGMDAALRDT